MKILVTGGAGFIGSNIAEYHLNKGDNVFIVDNLSTGNLKNIVNLQEEYPKHCHFEKADLLTWDNIEEVVSSVDRIYHMAAVVGLFRVFSDPEALILTNLDASERLFRYIAKSGNKPRVIFASSSGVYGNSSKDLMKEEDDLTVENPETMLSNYSISKLCDEIIGITYDHAKNIPTTMLRIFNTIGPHQTGTYGFVVPRFIAQACFNEPITIFGDGKQTRSFSDVRDIVKSMDIIAANLESRAQIINVGSQYEISILDLAMKIKNIAQSNSEIKFLSYEEAYGLNDYKDVIHRKPDLSKFLKITNYQFKWTLEKTLEDLIHRFYRENAPKK